MIDGILLIDKEEGKSSFFIIKKLKWQLPHKYKIGHAGTLDPFATGLLIILIGKATKLMDMIHSLEKEYVVTAEFGFATDTQDITGEKISECEKERQVQKEELEDIIRKKLIGKISQLPPIFSAKRVNGQRSYDIARKGEMVKLEPKDIEVKEFEIIAYKWPTVTFRIVCSTGTYIRTLIDDLGKYSGCFATAKSLRRTRIGKYNVEDALCSSSINEDTLDSIIGIDKVISDING